MPLFRKQESSMSSKGLSSREVWKEEAEKWNEELVKQYIEYTKRTDRFGAYTQDEWVVDAFIAVLKKVPERIFMDWHLHAFLTYPPDFIGYYSRTCGVAIEIAEERLKAEK